MPLNDAKIRTLMPREKPYKAADFEGLYLTITPSGSRLWHLKYRFGGKEKRLSFGAYPNISLADSRRLKDEARASLARGADPGAEKQERNRLGATFASHAEAFIEKARKEGRAKSTMDKMKWLNGMAINAFGSKPITVKGLSRTPYATAGPIREVIESAFTRAGLPAFAPHSFRMTIVKWGIGYYTTPEALKAFSQNIDHESLLTTYSAYLTVSQERQAELIRTQR